MRHSRVTLVDMVIVLVTISILSVFLVTGVNSHEEKHRDRMDELHSHINKLQLKLWQCEAEEW